MIKPPEPYLPYKWADNLPFVYAMKAMSKGEATESQQKLILAEMMALTGYYDLSYRPDSERDTAFAEGKRFIGAQLVKLITLSPDVIEKSKTQRKTR